MISIDYNDTAVLNALRELAQHAGNLRPALKEIGEDLKESTKQRFGTYTGPDGVMWATNSDATYERKGDRSGIPLTDYGTLGNTIGYRLVGNDEVQIGSPMEYAAMMQFGGTKDEFPHLWGDIPARPFLGISDADKDGILAVLRDYLTPG
ncbi:MAG: phage virion morphogenesis protein [Methylobacter sp.]|nr:phage virion morphogenesis protein [Methylobacter sp.]MDP2169635.1 phage virion morphogenesis protein [Rhodocyclaceae bacterium]MDP2429053.1 phage virion morphogenesis protein [Methylobacter sp.]MDP3056554.1 phage virion morphogenesis protein [Methylobacter sp.]MDP3362043.1 phage virion morphogenesis protein [Methylobacter sp.]